MFKFTILSFVLSVFASSASASNCPLPSSDATSFAAKRFDYLIIGGGTAGLAVAARLSEDTALQIGVIEAGIFHQNDPLVDEPGNAGVAEGNPSYDWSYITTPQPGANGQSIATPRGKMLGGSSGLNLMAWTRASQKEYDDFQVFAPGTGWNWNGLLGYMKKTVTVDSNLTNILAGLSPQAEAAARAEASTYEGLNGPINASYNVIGSDIVPDYVKTLNAVGIKSNADPDNGDSAGITNARSAIDRNHGVRSYAATGYYCQSASRSNLHVLVGAQVTKILFSGAKSPLFATGVTFVSESKNYAANATKDIVLSAGSVQTPQLLELSGIGNATLLNRLGIKTLVNLPGVGENLQEHLFAPAEFQLKPGFHTFDQLRNNATFAAEQAAEYAASGTGWLAADDYALGFNPFQSFLNASSVASLLETFDSSVSSMGKLTPLQVAQYAIQRSWLTEGTVPEVEVIPLTRGIIAPQPNASYISAIVGVQHPLARGSIHINTSDPIAYPVINGNYLSNAYDVEAILQGLKLFLRLGQTAPLSQDVTALISPIASNDTELITWIRTTVSPGSHILGTAAMAPQLLGGVVDPSLTVYGTSNLRVADASIIPIAIASHMQQTVYAIGEKLADMIKGSKP